MRADDRHYYERRAAEERQASARASCAAAAAAHDELAQQYSTLAHPKRMLRSVPPTADAFMPPRADGDADNFRQNRQS